jgi:hypothetical protein
MGDKLPAAGMLPLDGLGVPFRECGAAAAHGDQVEVAAFSARSGGGVTFKLNLTAVTQ